MNTITQKQHDILRHALGLDNPSARGKPYRNRYIIGPKCSGYADCTALVEASLMENYGTLNELSGGDDCFWVTPAGEEVAKSIYRAARVATVKELKL